MTAMAVTTLDIRRVELSFQTQCIIVIALSILLYDYCLNFAKEVNWIWRARSKTALTIVLYVLNRYLSILAIPVIMLKYFWQNPDPGRLDVCLHLTKFHYYVIFISQAFVAAVLIHRAYALYGKSKLVLVGTCAITVVAAALGIVGIIRSPSESFKPGDLLKTGTCILPTSLLVVGNYMPSIITAMILEMVIFVLTLIKSIQHMKSGSRILEVLLRDGIFYFGLVMLAHFGVILSYYLPQDATRGNLVTLGNCINSTLISRLMLHLRDPSLVQPDWSTADILSTVVDTRSWPDGTGMEEGATIFGDTHTGIKLESRYAASMSDTSSHV